MAIVNRPSLESGTGDDSASETDRLCDYVECLTATTGLDFVLEKDMPLVEYHNVHLDLCATSLGADENGNRWCVLLCWKKDNAPEGNIVLLNDEVKRLDREKVRAAYEERKNRIRNTIGSIVLTIGLALGTHDILKEKGTTQIPKNEPEPVKGLLKNVGRFELPRPDHRMIEKSGRMR